HQRQAAPPAHNQEKHNPPLLAPLPPQQSNLRRHRARGFTHSCNMRASLDGLDEGEFTEGHELDRKWKVAKRQTADNVSPANYRIFPALLQPFFPDIGVQLKPLELIQ